MLAVTYIILTKNQLVLVAGFITGMLCISSAVCSQDNYPTAFSGWSRKLLQLVYVQGQAGFANWRRKLTIDRWLRCDFFNIYICIFLHLYFTSFRVYFFSVIVWNMSSTQGLCLRWVTLSLLLLRCPGLTLLLLEAEEVALVEVYLEQRSDVSSLLHGEVVESSKDSNSIDHQDYDRETLEGELVLVSLSNVEPFSVVVIVNSTVTCVKLRIFLRRKTPKTPGLYHPSHSPLLLHVWSLLRKNCVQTSISNTHRSVRNTWGATSGVFFPQVQDEKIESGREKREDGGKDKEPWIGVVPVDIDDSKASTGNQESFTDIMVNKVRQSTELESGGVCCCAQWHVQSAKTSSLLKMKRALVLGASALIILALNQNTISEVILHLFNLLFS